MEYKVVLGFIYVDGKVLSINKKVVGKSGR